MKPLFPSSRIAFPTREQTPVDPDPQICFGGPSDVTLCGRGAEGPVIATLSTNTLTCQKCKLVLEVAIANGGVAALRKIAKKALGF